MELAELRKVIDRITDLPTLPAFLNKLSEVINDPKTSANDLGDIISKDQVQTSKLLKLVNSSFYGFPREIGSVKDAVVILGFNTIKKLCLSISIFNLFNKRSQTSFDREGFWEHSIGCAVGSKIIAKYAGYKEVEDLFVAGLLHDIGKVVLDSFFHEDFMRIMAKVEEDNSLIIHMEEEILKFTHADIGRLLAEKWKLPPKLVHTIAFHHDPLKAKEFTREASMVHLSDIMCRAKNIGSGGGRKVPPLIEGAWQSLHLKLSSIETIMEEMEIEFEETASIITSSSDTKHRSEGDRAEFSSREHNRPLQKKNRPYARSLP